MSRVMIVVAHPDDEVFGCGGTLLKHALNGDEIHIVTLTDGVSSRGNVNGKEDRHQGLMCVARDLNATFSSFDFNDNGMDTHPILTIIKRIESEIRQFIPEIIYTHHLGDLNIDHQICHKAVLTACRPEPGFSVKEIYAFEINSSTEWNSSSNNIFVPNMYVDISKVIKSKEKLIMYYQQELRSHPHIRSLEGLIIKNQIRGMEVGINYAEAFSVIRSIR